MAPSDAKRQKPKEFVIDARGESYETCRADKLPKETSLVIDAENQRAGGVRDADGCGNKLTLITDHLPSTFITIS
jgi:hypothetical protein